MRRTFFVPLIVGSLVGLSACGGAGPGGGTYSALQDYTNRYAALSSDPTLGSMSADATVNARNSNVTYTGVINIGTDAASNPAGAADYYGDLTATVNFSTATTNDALTGTAGNFVQYNSANPSSKTGSGVSGSLSLTGSLTGTNTTLRDGISGTASGTIDGISVAYGMEGNINGGGATGMTLFLTGTNADSANGVGMLVE